ncbi:MAG: MBL fold metallo-hydrolase [Armatimonadota bacterium]|nr:MBL fold metallo-hydrolase [bacterium]
MALVVNSLASGSSGNCILVRDDNTALLIDAGIGIRRIVAALGDVGVDPADLSGILITHEHSDHIAGAVRIARRYRVPLVGNALTLQRISDAENVPTRVLDVDEEMTVGELLVRPFPVSHDAAQPVGYAISSNSATVVSATDTGILTPRIRDEAAAADLLILESNHDEEMLLKGPYPWYLKKRIAGERGHISNDTASGLLLDLADSGKLISVWLAHLSKTNNSPKMALTTAQYLLWSCLGTTMDIDVALRDVPSLCWRQADHAAQLGLFTHESKLSCGV